MPRLETNAQQIVPIVSKFNIAEPMEALINIGGGKSFGKIGNAETGLPDIKISDSMK